MPISKNFIFKAVAGEYMIIPLSGGTVDMTKSFNINETGAFIYKGLDQGKTAEEIAEDMAKEYDAPKDELLKDINEFIAILKKKGIYND
ncbi:MAG: PqqD family protein [Acholeplasmatales bacterium]|nr:PqqD family protein [Acholeplasmatales bacterium]